MRDAVVTEPAAGALSCAVAGDCCRGAEHCGELGGQLGQPLPDAMRREGGAIWFPVGWEVAVRRAGPQTGLVGRRRCSGWEVKGARDGANGYLRGRLSSVASLAHEFLAVHSAKHQEGIDRLRRSALVAALLGALAVGDGRACACVGDRVKKVDCDCEFMRFF